MADAFFVELAGYLGHQAKGLRPGPKETPCGSQEGHTPQPDGVPPFFRLVRAASNQHVEMLDPIRWAGWICMHAGQRGVED